MSNLYAERVGPDIMLKSQFRDKPYIELLPGAQYDSKTTTWHLPLSWSACLALRASFGDRLEIGPALLAWAGTVRDLHVNIMMALRGADDWTGDVDLRHYQRVGVAFLTADLERIPGLTAEHIAEYDLGGKILGDDMGTGKTVMAARAMRKIYQVLGPEAVFPVIIVCPNTVKGAVGREKGWYGELARWFPEARVGIVRGTAPQRRKVLEAVATGELDIAVTNWENLRNHSRLAPYGSVRLEKCVVCEPQTSTRKQALCEVCPRELNHIAWRTVIADEAHRQSDPKSKQTRALWSIQHQKTVLWRWALTGTLADTIDRSWPISHGISAAEFPTKTKYIDRYALKGFSPYGGVDVVGIRPEMRDEFYGFFDPRFLRRPREYALRDLKEPTYEVRTVELSLKQKKVYNELADEMVGRLDDGETVVAPNPLTLTGRLNQAAAAFLRKDPCARCDGTGQKPGTHKAQPHPDEQYSEWYCRCAQRLDADVHKVVCTGCGGNGFIYWPENPSSKLDELELFIGDLPPGERVVVFAVSRKLIELAAERLTAKGISCVQITGAVPERQRYENVEALRTGEARVCLVVIDAGGEGLDGLQDACRIGVFLQRHYARRMNTQAEGRLLRSGQEGQVLFVDILSEGTIEEDKELLLAVKEERFQQIVRDPETLRRLLNIRP